MEAPREFSLSVTSALSGNIVWGPESVDTSTRVMDLLSRVAKLTQQRPLALQLVSGSREIAPLETLGDAGINESSPLIVVTSGLEKEITLLAQCLGYVDNKNEDLYVSTYDFENSESRSQHFCEYIGVRCGYQIPPELDAWLNLCGRWQADLVYLKDHPLHTWACKQLPVVYEIARPGVIYIAVGNDFTCEYWFIDLKGVLGAGSGAVWYACGSSLTDGFGDLRYFGMDFWLDFQYKLYKDSTSNDDNTDDAHKYTPPSKAVGHEGNRRVEADGVDSFDHSCECASFDCDPYFSMVEVELNFETKAALDRQLGAWMKRNHDLVRRCYMSFLTSNGLPLSVDPAESDFPIKIVFTGKHVSNNAAISGDEVHDDKVSSGRGDDNMLKPVAADLMAFLYHWVSSGYLPKKSQEDHNRPHH